MGVRRNYVFPTLIAACCLLSFLLWPATLDKDRGRQPLPPTAYQSENKYVTTDSIIVYRTFLDYRGREAAIRILAFRQCVRNETNRMDVEVYLHNGTMVKLSAVMEAIEGECPWHWAPTCNWSGHLISAPLPKNIPAKSLVSASLINMESLLPLSQLTIVETNKASQKSNLAICVLPLYWFSDWLQIAQFFEIWRLQGATQFFVYYHSVSETVDQLLTAYEKEGLVVRIPWMLLPKSSRVDPNRGIYRLGHNIAQNDCMYRTVGRAKFVALVDFDEYIIPSSGTLLQYLQSSLKKNPSAGSFKFRHFRLAFRGERPSGRVSMEDVTFDWLLKASMLDDGEGLSGPMKTVFLPDRTDVLLTHQVRLHFPGFFQIAVDAGEAMLLHARANWQQIPASDNSSYAIKRLFDESLRRAVLSQYRHIFHKYFLPDTKFTLDYAVRKALTICLSDWKGIGCKTPYHSCYQRVHNMTNWIFSIPDRLSGNYLVL